MKVDRLKIIQRSSLALWAALLVMTDEVSAQTAMQIGSDCSIQNVVATNGTLKLENVVINCGKGAEPRTALKVNYYWLDAISAGLLLDGRYDARLSSLLGPKPVLAMNEVAENLLDLQKRFGTTIGSHSLFKEYYSHVTTKIDGIQGTNVEYLSKNIPYRATSYSSLRIFDGMNPIYWPDITAIKEISKTPQFPSKYKSYVRGEAVALSLPATGKKLSETDATRVMNAALISRVFHNSVSSGELSAYRDSLLAMRTFGSTNGNEIGAPWYFDDVTKLKPPLSDDEEKRPKELVQRLPELSGSKTVAAIRYVSREGLPEDFVNAFGMIDAHTDVPTGWSFMVLPRRLYMQIAVIENAATTPTDYSLSGFTVQRSSNTKLRSRKNDLAYEERQLPFPQGRLSHKERVVIPLALEFREHRKLGDEDRQIDLAADDAAHLALKQALERLPRDTVIARDEYDNNKPTNFLPPKPKQLFMAHEPLKVEAAYLYGTSFRLKAAHLQGIDIAIRDAQAAGIYRVAGFDGGSCPIVYYRTYGMDGWLKLGSVLRNSLGIERRTRETYELPVDVAEVAIVEEEPEVSHIERMAVEVEASDGTRNEISSATVPFRLDVGDARRLTVSPTQSRAIRLHVEGYYIPYSILQTSFR